MSELIFSGDHETKLDAKGRSSIPAPFRSQLKAQGRSSFFAYPNRHQSGALVCCDISEMKLLKAAMNQLSPISATRRKMELSIFSRAHEIVFDSDGRTVIPKALRNAAGLDGTIYFAGRGETFEIWNDRVYQASQETPPDLTDDEEHAFNQAWAKAKAAEEARP